MMNENSMVTVIAKCSFSTGEISMFKGEIRSIREIDAVSLIASGYVEEYENVISMPSVTSSDSGKVATVDNSGAWVAANPSGGEGNIILYLKSSDFTENKPMDIYTSPLYNQTITESDFDEIYAKYRKNANIVFKSNNELYFPIIVKMNKQGTTRTIDAVIGYSSGYQGGTATVTMKQVWYSYSEEVSS